MSRALPVVHDLIPLDKIKVAAPCDMDWEQMRGDDKKRFCNDCSLNVYNFSAMSHVEMTTLIRETEGRVCGRLYLRHDGTVLTNDCPVGLATRAYRSAKRGALVAAGGVFTLVTFLLVALFAFSNKEVPTGVLEVLTPDILEIERPMMGKIAPRKTMGEIAPIEVMGDIAIEE